MTELEILAAIGVGEDSEWEFKAAQGGLPANVWETYSGMANTDGGTIILGVKEKDGSFEVVGLAKPAQIKKAIWDCVNDRGKVSTNLLSEDDVVSLEVAGKQIVIMRVPRADRRQRPVFVGLNPLVGTYRRNHEGDYHCREDEVGRMLADRGDDPEDSRILEGFGLDDLDPESLRQYRQQFADRQADHAWRSMDDIPFLTKIGAWRTDRRSGEAGLTVAGLLMLGRDEAILDPAAVPKFHLDYRERLSDNPAVRWTDRLTYDGKWVCNVFQFYHRVITKLTANLPVPFELDDDQVRRGDTPVHRAVREALTNALVHADYRGQGGVVVEKYRDRLEFSNPGTLLVAVDQILRGGVSECRNKSLQMMFDLIGYGERAGSGWDTIRRGLNSQNWRAPSIDETLRPDRVLVVLPMESLLPEDALTALRGRFGAKFRRLNNLQVIALATAFCEGGITNRRLQAMSSEHPSELTKLLQGLVSKGFIVQVGERRGAEYRLVGEADVIRAGTAMRGDSSHTGDSSHMEKRDSSHKDAALSESDLAQLREISASARSARRMSATDLRDMILQLCSGRYLESAVLADLLGRSLNNLRSRFLTPMVAEGLLARRYPDEPNRPDQAYTTVQR